MIHRPTSGKYNTENGLLVLRFVQDPECEEKNPECSICKLLKEICEKTDQVDVEIPHYVRGAIVWPVGRYPGYALVSAQNVNSPEKEVRILEESPFWTIGNRPFQKGIWHFFQKAWEEYRCRSFFYLKSPEHRRYWLQVLREPALREIKPTFLEAILATESEDSADNLIQEYHRLGRLKIDEDYGIKMENFDVLVGNLKTQLDKFVGGEITEVERVPAVKALRALVAGYERVPYRGPVPY